MIDYIIVGFGIAGSTLAYHLEKAKKTFLVIDSRCTKASEVAGGLYNPIVLKRYTLAWNATEQLEYAIKFYTDLEDSLDIVINEPLPVLRKFHSAKEQNNWFSKIDKPELSKYLSPYLVSEPTTAINAPFKYGQVMGSGRILIKKMLSYYAQNLINRKAYLEDVFDFKKFEILKQGGVSYKNVTASNIVFCEGFRLVNNPYFKHLPLVGNKGSYLIIESEGLKLKQALKAHFFLIPLGGNRYKFGATYQHQIKTDNHDKGAYDQLVNYLNDLLSVPYKIIEQELAVRPTVTDRRPLVGQHPIHKSLFVLNGLGTRGIMVGPTMANYLVNFIENGVSLPQEINCNRFI